MMLTKTNFKIPKKSIQIYEPKTEVKNGPQRVTALLPDLVLSFLVSVCPAGVLQPPMLLGASRTVSSAQFPRVPSEKRSGNENLIARSHNKTENQR